MRKRVSSRPSVLPSLLGDYRAGMRAMVLALLVAVSLSVVAGASRCPGGLGAHHWRRRRADGRCLATGSLLSPATPACRRRQVVLLAPPAASVIRLSRRGRIDAGGNTHAGFLCDEQEPRRSRS